MWWWDVFRTAKNTDYLQMAPYCLASLCELFFKQSVPQFTRAEAWVKQRRIMGRWKRMEEALGGSCKRTRALSHILALQRVFGYHRGAPWK